MSDAALLAELLDAVPLDARATRPALDLLRGADRHYHGLAHVELLWRRHRELAREAGIEDARGLVAGAILFHDCVYVAGRHDNEERSAQMWLDASAGVAADEREWVARTIRATRDHLGWAADACRDGRPHGPEALRLWMLDLDLTPLGEAPDVFDHNAELLRREARHLDEAAFAVAQAGVLRRFAAADAIYRTPALAARFEAPARRNLARHLDLLDATRETAGHVPTR